MPLMHIGSADNPEHTRVSVGILQLDMMHSFGFRENFVHTLCGVLVGELDGRNEWYWKPTVFEAFKKTPDNVCPACNMQFLARIEM